jgi:hypothetical protein
LGFLGADDAPAEVGILLTEPTDLSKIDLDFLTVFAPHVAQRGRVEHQALFYLRPLQMIRPTRFRARLG